MAIDELPPRDFAIASVLEWIGAEQQRLAESIVRLDALCELRDMLERAEDDLGYAGVDLEDLPAWASSRGHEQRARLAAVLAAATGDPIEMYLPDPMEVAPA